MPTATQPVPIPQRVKKVEEVRTLTFNFVDKLVTDDSLTGAAVMTYPAGLTEIATLRSGARVASQFSGGVEDTAYPVRCACSTANGDTLILDVIVLVDADAN